MYAVHTSAVHLPCVAKSTACTTFFKDIAVQCVQMHQSAYKCNVLQGKQDKKKMHRMWNAYKKCIRYAVMDALWCEWALRACSRSTYCHPLKWEPTAQQLRPLHAVAGRLWCYRIHFNGSHSAVPPAECNTPFNFCCACEANNHSCRMGTVLSICIATF